MFHTEERTFDQRKHRSIFASSLRCGAKISVFLSYLEGRGRIYSPWGWIPWIPYLCHSAGLYWGLHYMVGKFLYDSWGGFLCVFHPTDIEETRCGTSLLGGGAQFTNVEGPLIGSYMHGTGIRATRTFLCINAHRCLSALHVLRSLEWGLWVS